jgi:hypothetical protein
MPLDHYVSQVHLRKFYAADLNRIMYAVRKRDGFEFTPNSRSICRLDDGNTNRYLSEPRAIEEFLTTVEPSYDGAIAGLTTGNPSHDDIYVISGFIAYVLSCSPAVLRLESYPMRRMIEHVGVALDEAGELPPMPESMVSNFADALQRGSLNVRVDQMYPHAVGVTQIYSRLRAFANSDWLILINQTNCPFLTSDFPVAYGPPNAHPFVYRTFPLSPTLALRIRTTEQSRVADDEFRFPNIRVGLHETSRREAIEINQSIVRCAESEVYSSTMSDPLRGFIRRNSNYRIESTYDIVGPYHIASTRVQEHNWGAA